MPAPKTKSYPLRLSDELKKDIDDTAAAAKLDFPDTARMAIRFGLPIVREKLGASGRTPSPRSTASPP